MANKKAIGKKNEKNSFLKKVMVPFGRIAKYFKEVVAEMKKVTWPTRKQLLNTTWIVTGVIVAFGIFIGLADLLLGQILVLLS